MPLDRRSFLKAGALAGTGLLAGPRLLFGASGGLPPADIVVAVFLRGGADPLQMVCPYADANYAALRPTIAIPEPGAANGALDLDGFYGLHPALAPLLPLYQSGQLGIVHATGLKHDERSHFACQDHVETGIHDLAGGGHGGHSGWLNRWVDGAGNPGGFTAIGMGSALQMALRGDADALAMPSMAGFSFASTSSRRVALQDQLEAMHGRSTAICGAARQAVANAEYLAAMQPGLLPVENGAVYPTGSFGTQLKEVAQMIKANLGLRVACVDLNGFDHHDAINVELPPLLDELARALAAFHQDLGTRMNGVTLLTISEFGRRVAENASAGTDHGCGSLMLLLGGGVLGGRVYADWPGLGPSQLFNGDLDVTIDYRTVLTELMAKRLGAPGAELVFPDVAGLPMAGCFTDRRARPVYLRRRPTPQPTAPLA
jgi:uncharacterized protein (DUF1501 family)